MGKVRAQQGFFTVERTCPTCNGLGQIIKNPCRSCDGAGRVEKERTLSVNIPAGVETGTRIRLAGEGEAGMRGGPPGDLYIFIEVESHPIFERDAPNLYCRVPVSMATAALGGDIEVPTIDGGRARVKIPEGAQSGRQMRLRGKGMPALRGGRGGRHVHRARGRDAGEPQPPAEGAPARVRGGGAGQQPGDAGFFSAVKGFWDGMKG